MERAAAIYGNFADEGFRDTERRTTPSVKRVDYMTVYTSDLVAAVRKAAGNIGNNFIYISCAGGGKSMFSES